MLWFLSKEEAEWIDYSERYKHKIKEGCPEEIKEKLQKMFDAIDSQPKHKRTSNKYYWEKFIDKSNKDY